MVDRTNNFSSIKNNSEPAPTGSQKLEGPALYEEVMKKESLREGLSFLTGPMDSQLSNMKGRAYIYKMNEDYKKESMAKLQNMQYGMICNEMNSGLALHKHPLVKYPYCTHRVDGRVWPGEERRVMRKTQARKATRTQAEQLCKFMLFRKGKFLPGKMV